MTGLALNFKKWLERAQLGDKICYPMISAIFELENFVQTYISEQLVGRGCQVLILKTACEDSGPGSLQI